LGTAVPFLQYFRGGINPALRESGFREHFVTLCGNAIHSAPLRLSSQLCTGIFDLFHFGHAKALEQAKKL